MLAQKDSMISDKIKTIEPVVTGCSLVRQDEFLGHRRFVLDFKGRSAWVVDVPEEDLIVNFLKGQD